MQPQTLRGSCQVVAVACAVVGVALNGYFAVLFLSSAVFDFKRHLWWQPGLWVAAAALELLVLARAVRTATRSQDVVPLLTVIVVVFTVNVFGLGLLGGLALL